MGQLDGFNLDSPTAGTAAFEKREQRRHRSGSHHGVAVHKLNVSLKKQILETKEINISVSRVVKPDAFKRYGSTAGLARVHPPHHGGVLRRLRGEVRQRPHHHPPHLHHLRSYCSSCARARARAVGSSRV
jgi:hypothetical protein